MDSLPELQVKVDDYEYPDRDEAMAVISNTDPLSMKKAFPVSLGAYTFVNREQLMAYVAEWLAGRREEAKKIANAKKYPSKNFRVPLSVDWTVWAPALAYAIASKRAEDPAFREALLDTGESPIGAAGNSTEWELGQDKSTAGRTEPPHHWGRNAWGRALSRLRTELKGTVQEVEMDNPLDVGLVAYLNGKVGATTRRELLSAMMIGEESVWLNTDAREQWLYNYRQAVDRGQGALDELSGWIATAPTTFSDAHAFIASLPNFEPVRVATQRERDAILLTVNTEQSYEKCKACGKGVRVSLVQMRRSDEPPTPVAKCYNTETCATLTEERGPDGRLVPVVIPYTYIQKTNYRAYLKQV